VFQHLKSSSPWIVIMAEDHATETMNTERMTTAARFYHLHREQVLAQRKAAYDARPDVIARREQKKEKDALLLQKKQEDATKKEAKQKKIQELALIAEKTKRAKPSQSSPSEENPRL
jgi:hypothetical protein